VQPVGHLVEESSERLVQVLGDRPKITDARAVLGERRVHVPSIPRSEPIGEGGLADEFHEAVRHLAPFSRDAVRRHEHRSIRTEHTSQLGDRALPRRDQMQEVTNHGDTERVVTERERRRVGAHEREWRVAAGLLDELPEHRRGDVDPDHRDTGVREWQRDESGPDTDLETAPTPSHLVGEHRRHLARRFLGQTARAVVVLDRSIEGHRAAHDFGISLFGSTNGNVATVAGRAPSPSRSSTRVPISMCDAGTQA
jgi:hypothetical protein